MFLDFAAWFIDRHSLSAEVLVEFRKRLRFFAWVTLPMGFCVRLFVFFPTTPSNARIFIRGLSEQGGDFQVTLIPARDFQ